jgi:RNase P/RNase MRP subunit POP5
VITAKEILKELLDSPDSVLGDAIEHAQMQLRGEARDKSDEEDLLRCLRELEETIKEALSLLDKGAG